MRRVLFALVALITFAVPVVNGTAAVPAAAAANRTGYWMLGSNGQVFAFGDAQWHGDQAGGVRSVDLEPTPSGDGYWILSGAGAVDAFGDAKGRVVIDRLASLDDGEEATSLSATPSGNGLWVFTSRGRVTAYGDARHHGDLGEIRLNGPVLDAVPTPSGRGYYMVGSDGGIFSFGDARFYGSMGGRRLNAPVQSLVPDHDGAGYWLVASDGGIFAFDASYRGSMGGTRLNKQVVGMVRFGDGYLMVGEDGGIFSFSDEPFLGSLGSRPPASPIVSVAAFNAARVEVATSPSSSSDSPGATIPAPTTATTEAAAPATTTTSTGPAATPTSTAPPTTTTTRPPGADPSSGVPTYEYNCYTGQTIRVWIYERSTNAETWAVDNACTDNWVVIGVPITNESGRFLSVAPQTSFRLPAEGWMTERLGTEYVDVNSDPRTTCDPGYELWEIGPDTGGQLELLTVCPTRDEEGDLRYAGPLCFGRIPDHIGSDRDDHWGNEDDDVNDDGAVTIYGAGGSDSWGSGSIDSGTFTDTLFCGGPGDDSGRGWLAAIDGGDGSDRFSPTACGDPPTIVNVEIVHPESDCPEGTP